MTKGVAQKDGGMTQTSTGDTNFKRFNAQHSTRVMTLEPRYSEGHGYLPELLSSNNVERPAVLGAFLGSFPGVFGGRGVALTRTIEPVLLRGYWFGIQIAIIITKRLVLLFSPSQNQFGLVSTDRNNLTR